jgi:DNA helicase-2/ATP-dependent DNA helicase PcrA
MKSKFPPKTSDKSHIIKARPKLNWSDYQKAIFKNVHSGVGNTAIIARAGSSKTTTLVEALRYVPRGKKILVVAFNKSIAEELKTRIPDSIDCATLHSLGYRAVRQKFGNDVVLEDKKCLIIIKDLIGDEDYDFNMEVAKTVSLCKSALMDVPSKIVDLMDKYGIDPQPYKSEDFAKLVCKVLGECKKKNKVIDFDDMIYFPFIYNLNIGKWDYIFVDEAQDMSYSQLILALSAAKPTSRTFVFLDDRQAIYGFRGCDIESVQTIIKKLNPTKLSLPISYRCPKRVIKIAQEIVPDITTPDDAADGSVTEIVPEELLKFIKPGDFVLSRTNAPLVKFCMSALKAGIPSNIQGRDIGSNLLYFVKKSKAKTINSFIEYVNEWRTIEVRRLMSEKKDTTITIDKAECLLNLCEGITTIKDLKETIEKLFSDVDDSAKVVFSTTHKAKGLERDRVFVLTNTYRKEQGGEEANLYYVAITRAKDSLFLVRKSLLTAKY